MYYAIICGLFVGLLVYIIWLWDKSRGKETKRLYAWLDDILDRIGSEGIEQYALTQRIKYEILSQAKQSTTAPTGPKEEVKVPPAFVQQRR